MSGTQQKADVRPKHETNDISGIWNAPLIEEAPALFVSLQSLKDPAYTGDPTAEVLALVDGALFSRWMEKVDGTRPSDYAPSRT